MARSKAPFPKPLHHKGYAVIDVYDAGKSISQLVHLVRNFFGVSGRSAQDGDQNTILSH